MAILNFTLSEEGVSAFRDALICLSKFSDDVSLESRRDTFTLTTLNSSKSAYASFKFQTNRFFSRYSYTGHKERFYCTLYIRALISLFRSRTSHDGSAPTVGTGPKEAGEKTTLIERCDVAIEDGEGVSSRFIARIVFRNGLTSTHRLPFEVSAPVHARFEKANAPHQWKIASRTLRQLMDHFGPGIELLDINTDGDHVNFTCFSEKTVAEDAVLKKPLQTSIAVEVDEFDDIDVEDKLHIVISVKDFRAIIQHAGNTGNDISARYSLPAKPIQLTYASDAISCEFLIMTVGERGTNPTQRTKKSRKTNSAPQNTGPRLEAASRRTSVAPSEAQGQPADRETSQMPPPARVHPHPTPQPSAARASASRIGAFDLRPTQQAPPPTNQSESLFVEDEGWEPVHDPDDDEDDARLEWNHSADPNHNPSALHMSRADEQRQPDAVDMQLRPDPNSDSQFLEPTQRLSQVANLALFPD